MHYEVLEQLTHDRRAALVREAEEARLVAASAVPRRRRRALAVALDLLRARSASARAETQA